MEVDMRKKLSHVEKCRPLWLIRRTKLSVVGVLLTKEDEGTTKWRAEMYIFLIRLKLFTTEKEVLSMTFSAFLKVIHFYASSLLAFLKAIHSYPPAVVSSLHIHYILYYFYPSQSCSPLFLRFIDKYCPFWSSVLLHSHTT